MTEKCARCSVNGEVVKLYDAIYDNEMALLCERCSIIENVPIIQKPTTSQLKTAERRGLAVNERLKDMAGLSTHQKKEYISPKERLVMLNQNPELEVPDERRLDLIEHFDWEIMKNRRRKGLSQRQLAEMLNESENAIDMLEKGRIPSEAEVLISKLEQFFQIKLRRMTYFDKISQETKKNPVLLDGYGNPLDRIPEPEVKCNVEVSHDSKTPLLDGMEVTECKVEKPERPKMSIFSFFKRKQVEEPEVSQELVEEVIEKNPVNQIQHEKMEKAKAYMKFREPKSDRPISRYMRYREMEKQRGNKQITDNKPISNQNKNVPPIIQNQEQSFELPPEEDLDLNKIDISKVKIGDLKIAHKAKIETTKLDKTYEQKRIEERQKLTDGRKEELRIKKEKESKNIDEHLGGSELLK